MSDIEKAARDAVEAADNTELVRTIAAILAVQKVTEAQTPAPRPTPREFDARKWLVIGGLGIAGAGVACFLAMAAAVLAIAIAVGACCATACLLVLRSMWRDLRK